MTFQTEVVMTAATVAAACKSCIITIEDAKDGVSGQPIRSKDGRQVYRLCLSAPDLTEMVNRYQCAAGFERFPQISTVVYTAIFTEIHRRISKLHAGEFCGRVVNCAEVAK